MGWGGAGWLKLFKTKQVSGVASQVELRFFTQAWRCQIFLTPASKFCRTGVKLNMMPKGKPEKRVQSISAIASKFRRRVICVKALRGRWGWVG